MKRITESQLRNMIRQCVYESIDECGIEEIDKNSLNKAGKYAAIGALGATTLFKGCEKLSDLEQKMLDSEKAGLEMMYDADHEFELDKARTAYPFDESKVRRMVESIVRKQLQEKIGRQMLSELDWKTYASYQQGRMNQAKQAEQQGDFDAAKMYRQKAIRGGNAAGEALRKKHGYNSIDDFNQQQQAIRNNATGKYVNPDAVKQRAQNYNQDTNDFYTGKSQYVKGKGWVSEMTNKVVNNALAESTLYTDDIDSSDLIVNVEPYTEDGYCEWEATCDNGWYTFRGWYSRGRCELEDVISGHSGHGMQHGVDDELRDWFYDNLEDRVISEIEAQA